MDKYFGIDNNKIWIVWDNRYDICIISHNEQHVTVFIKGMLGADLIVLTIIYAKCSNQLMEELWEAIVSQSRSVSCP